MPEFAVNKLKKKIADGGVGIIANGPNTSELCDYIGQYGFDAAFIDFEHGGVSWRELADITRACELWGMSSIVRVNKLDEALILRTLDQGASGVVVPHVVTADDARHAAAACRYPPDGNRGVAGSRRAYGVDDYFKRANEEVTCTALIEDYAAVQNIEALIEVDGIDVFYVAPSDLAASMGHTGNPGHPDVQAAITGALTTIVNGGRVAGTLTTEDNIDRYLDLGVRCIGFAYFNWIASNAPRFLEKIAGR